ncbi:MAG: hypothetical protein SOU07_00315 [Bacilli bacterium]|nr:hypothetical protein [Acholeplasmataceae bacterium]MDY2901873.1 hypothetical protein [Bacilli bacterium]
MPFCKYCGKEIEQGEVCKECEESMVVDAKPVDQANVTNNVNVKDDSKLTKGLVIATSIIYPLILIVLASVFYFNGTIKIANYLLSILFSIICGACTLLGGFYLIVIYLYFISLFRVGCAKKNDLALWKRIILGISAVVSFVLALILIFVK